MTDHPVPAGQRIGLAIALSATLLLAGSAVPFASVAPANPGVRPRTDWAPPNPATAGSAALTAPGLPLTAPPVAVPLELWLPTLLVSAPVLGVGIDAAGAMDAPMGPPGDPVWQQAFWYRGSSVPGAFSTAVIAGHVDGGGQLGAFAHLDDLRPGDPVIVHNTKTGVDMKYAVTGSESIPLEQTTDPAVLSRIYGVGPVVGSRPLASTDGRSHLTLVTCAGKFRDGTHDHRLVVQATRVT
jgi:hypothetical protein